MKKKTLLTLILVLAVVIGLAFVLQRIQQSRENGSGKFANYLDSEVPPNTQRFMMEMNNLAITFGPTRIDLNKGDKALIGITSKDAYEVSIVLDGYNIRTEANAGALGQIEFTADKPGLFNILAIPSFEDGQQAQPKVLAVVEVR